MTVVAERYDGKRLNSPNDVVVRSDGSVWFTDPWYGIDSHYEGDQADSEIGGCHVYRVDPQSGACHIVADDFVRPNGLAFSPDEQWLYIADSGGTSAKDGPRHIRKFRVDRGKELSGGQVFAECTRRLLRRPAVRRIRPHLDERRRTACTSTIRTVRCSGRSGFPSASRTWCSAAQNGTTSSSAPRPRCIRCSCRYGAPGPSDYRGGGSVEDGAGWPSIVFGSISSMRVPSGSNRLICRLRLMPVRTSIGRV